MLYSYAAPVCSSFLLTVLILRFWFSAFLFFLLDSELLEGRDLVSSLGGAQSARRVGLSTLETRQMSYLIFLNVLK